MRSYKIVSQKSRVCTMEAEATSATLGTSVNSANRIVIESFSSRTCFSQLVQLTSGFRPLQTLREASLSPSEPLPGSERSRLPHGHLVNENRDD